MRVGARSSSVAVMLTLAALLPAAVAAQELPPGWSGGEEPAPPPAVTPATEEPVEETSAWPNTDPAESQAAPGLPFYSLFSSAAEDEVEPQLTASELEIANALLPTCDSPYVEGFSMLVFPQPDEATTFSDTFGADRSGDRLHKGTDIFGPKGAPVVAIADGVVSKVSTGTLAGHYVVVDHDDGWRSKYMHLNNDTPGTDDGAGTLEMALAEGIEPGAEVVTGQLLGWVGDSGNAEGTPSHTHFELWQDGHLANPITCLEVAWERQLRAWEWLAEVF